MSGAVQIFFDGVVQGNGVRVEVACHISVPYADSFFQGILSDTASYPLVGRAEMEVYGVPLAEFQFSQHGVPAELIASVHEFFQAEGGDLVAGHAAAGAEAFQFPVKVMQRQAYKGFVCLPVVVHQCLAHRFFFRNAGFEAMFGKVGQQRAQVVAPSPVVQIAEGAVEGGLEEQVACVRHFVAGSHSQQRIAFLLFPLAVVVFRGQGAGLFQAEGHGGGAIIGLFVHGHPAAL